MDKSKIKLIAYYLPQFYEIEFNNQFYGKGYTEWTATAKATPLFKGHYQPHVPADLGFYNLLMPETREAQAQMAQEYGVDGFCYWHYWFGNGETIMEKPLQAVLESKKPDFPFCLCWANHSWIKPGTTQLIKEQQYLGDEDYRNHFNYVLKAFKDERYIKVEGKPVFDIFDPVSIPNIDHFIDLWNRWAKEAGFPGIYFIGMTQTPDAMAKILNTHLDAFNAVRLKDFYYHQNKYMDLIRGWLGIPLTRYAYIKAQKYFTNDQDKDDRILPTIIPGWDHSPRRGKSGLILTDYTPEAFEIHVRSVMEILSQKQNKLCFIKAWNEWGENNYLEPDLKYGRAFLEVLKKVKDEYQR